MKELLLSSLLILAGCAQLQPVKGNGRYLQMRDAYGEAFIQVDTPTPSGCIAEAGEFKKGAGFFSSVDLECTDNTLEKQMPWSVSTTNHMTDTTIIYRFRTKSLCAKVAIEYWENTSPEQKKLWTVGDCKADPACDYCNVRPANR